jgi:hypothetical protein
VQVQALALVQVLVQVQALVQALVLVLVRVQVQALVLVRVQVQVQADRSCPHLALLPAPRCLRTQQVASCWTVLLLSWISRIRDGFSWD